MKNLLHEILEILNRAFDSLTGICVARAASIESFGSGPSRANVRPDAAVILPLEPGEGKTGIIRLPPLGEDQDPLIYYERWCQKNPQLAIRSFATVTASGQLTIYVDWHVQGNRS